jgi:hypothetical protein
MSSAPENNNDKSGSYSEMLGSDYVGTSGKETSGGARNVGERFEKLLSFLEKLPAIDLPAGRKSIGHGFFDDGNWWVKFRIDTEHELAWRHVQELGFVLNYVSVQERLPTTFMPVSPPPYMNGGVEFLSWVIESKDASFTPNRCTEWLEGRLPKPVDDENQWRMDE